MRPEYRLKLGTLVEVHLEHKGKPRLATVFGVWTQGKREKVNVPGQCPQNSHGDDCGGYLLMMSDTGEWARAFFVDETIGYLKPIDMESGA